MHKQYHVAVIMTLIDIECEGGEPKELGRMVVQVRTQAWATCFLQSNSYLLRLHNSISTIIAVSKVVAQRYWVHTIAMTGCVLCCKFTERSPISASVKLTVSRCVISESVKWSVVCIAYNPLIPNQYRIVEGKKETKEISKAHLT